MAKYIVKTINERNLVIEADRFPSIDHNNHAYEFYKDGGIVALVTQANVFAIVEWDADISDFYYSDHEIDDNFNASYRHSNLGRSANSPEDDLDDVCIDCRNEELFDSQEFFNAVADVFYALTEPDEDESSPPEPAVPTPKIEKRIGELGNQQVGFVTPKGWVGWCAENEEAAKTGLKMYLDGETNWYYAPIGKTQVIQ